MRIGTMVGDTLRSLFKKPATEVYPFERRPTPERTRGRLTWSPDACSGCNLCVRTARPMRWS